ncbi:unnamed protein product [Urochloa humidicola]
MVGAAPRLATGGGAPRPSLSRSGRLGRGWRHLMVRPGLASAGASGSSALGVRQRLGPQHAAQQRLGPGGVRTGMAVAATAAARGRGRPRRWNRQAVQQRRPLLPDGAGRASSSGALSSPAACNPCVATAPWRRASRPAPAAPRVQADGVVGGAAARLGR